MTKVILSNIAIECCHILSSLQNLEERERKHAVHKEQLSREHRFLRRRLEQLTTLQPGHLHPTLRPNGHHGHHGHHHGVTLSSSAPSASSATPPSLISKRRSISECSVGTATSTSSTVSSRNSDRSAGSPSVSESGESFLSSSLYHNLGNFFVSFRYKLNDVVLLYIIIYLRSDI